MANADSTTTTNTENLVFQPVTESTIAKLLKIPLGASHDLFQVLDACEAYVDELIENEDITERMALCGRLLAGLEVLRTVLKEPLPEHLIQQLTVEDDNFNDNSHALCSDSETIREYCQGMTIILLNQQNTAESQQQITGLLFELIHLLADDLKTPRFVRTADGLAMINREVRSGIH
jgi:hypothetical protein